MQLVRWVRILALASLATLAGGLVACSTTSFKSTWQDPQVGRLDFKGKRVAALVLTQNEALRRNGETALAQELAKRGVQPIPGYEFLSSDDLKNRDTVRAKLRESGAEGAVVMRVIDRRQEVNYVPGAGPYDGSFYGYWGYGWSAVSDPGYLTTDTIVSVETMVYSVTDDKLLWAGVSETIDPGRLDSSIADIVNKAAKEMKKSGLIGD